VKYLNVILTIIAVLLALHLVKPFFISTAVANKWQDVNIVAIGGKEVDMPLYGSAYHGSALPVRIIE
jgi:hypothetical protein